MIAVPMLDPKGKLSEELAKELAADGEESAADVLKNRGWVPQEGPCVALLAEIKENKVIGMKMTAFSGLTEGGDIEVEWEMEQLWSDITRKIRTVVTLDLDSFEFPGAGKGPRNLSSWMSGTEVKNVAYWEEDEEKKRTELTADDEEDLALNERPWSLRATISMGDSKKAALHVGVIPVAKTRLQTGLDFWKLGIKEDEELVPTLQTYIVDRGVGQEGWNDPWSITLKTLPQEKKEDGLGLGILPILGGPEAERKLPTREDLAKEMQDVLGSARGRCTWKRRTATKLGSFFQRGEEEAKKVPTLKQLKDVLDKCPKSWPSFLEATAKRPGKNGPIRVERKKYREQGGFSREAVSRLGLSREVEEIVVSMANCSLAQTTWRAYSTAERAAERCQREMGVQLRMPWGEREAVVFAVWAINKELASSTITQYMSGIKNAHKREGLETGPMGSNLVKAVLKGKANVERPRRQKIAMTPGVLYKLKKYIIRCKMSYVDKCTLWAMCTVMYSGSLRGSEIMGEKENEFDPENILMEEDVRIKMIRTGNGRVTKLVHCVIRNPKELPGTKRLEVEMFQTSNKFCPVAAVEKLKAARTENRGKPFMTRQDGRITTKDWLNRFLKKALEEVINYEEFTVSSHSFRAGVASAMARCGYSDEEIQRQGRWRSEAFLKYIRLGRSQRLEQQRKLAEELADIAEAEVEEGIRNRIE